MSKQLSAIRLFVFLLVVGLYAPVSSLGQDALWLELNTRGMKAYENGDVDSAE